MNDMMKSESVREKVRAGYGQIAKSSGSCCSASASCCGGEPIGSEKLAQNIGYSDQELAALPDGANMGLSCGNPNVLAALQPGETVLDLGAGGGFDVFIAGRKVGAGGRAIGVDMTPEMLAKARNNIAAYCQRTGLNNVEFRLGEIEHLPLADASVDVVISNCVVNLSPDKPQVWREIARVLKPGGRVAVSDLALLKPLPDAILKSVEALLGCVAGAVLVSETERMAREAGLTEIITLGKSAYIDGMTDCQDPLYQNIISQLPPGARTSDYITSLEIKARKPASSLNPVSPIKPKGSPNRLAIYDPAMCCSTGVCGPVVDTKLAQFAADVKWLQEQGVEVTRFSLSQSPMAFVENETVKSLLTTKGEAALPLLLVNEKVAASGQYPDHAELILALGIKTGEIQNRFNPEIAELVAIGAAIAANCEPCFKYHFRKAKLLGVSKSDMAEAVKIAVSVKDSPHQSVLRLANRLTAAGVDAAEAAGDPCCGNNLQTDKSKSSCCDT